MKGAARAFFTLDLGTATTSAAVIARLGDRWRLLASSAAPASVPEDAILRLLLDRLGAADGSLADELGADARALDRWARVTCRSRPTRRLAVVAVTERSLAPLVLAASRAGWRIAPVSAETTGPLDVTRLLLDPATDAVLLGAGEPPGADERSNLAEIGALVAAVAVRRPDLPIVLAGAMAEQRDRVDPTGGRPGRVLIAPPATAGDPEGEPLRALVEELRVADDDSRRGIVRATASLADALDRRVEVVEVGMGASLRAVAAPGSGDERARVRSATVAAAGFDPGDPDDAAVDRVAAWSTVPFDRHRLRDRLQELHLVPWCDAHGDGAMLRLAVARASLERLAEATPDLGREAAPDLLVAAGGAWAVAPGPAIALALADVIRRPGASQLAYDHGRVLGPLGTIGDEDERRSVIGDLAADLLVPLASVIIPAGMRLGRSAGRMLVRSSTGTVELDLVPGGLELVDLPPGETAVADLEFRDAVRLPVRGRRFQVHVAGGLGGLLVDLRDVPLRLPERQERRRELLASWQDALWAGVEA